MKHIIQPTAKSCGQTCIAMLAQTSVRKVLELLPDKKGGTTAKQLVTAAGQLGVTFDKLPPHYNFKQVPRTITAVFRVMWREKRHRTHWIVIDNGLVFDPGLPSAVTLSPYLAMLERKGGRIVSYIEVLDCEPPATALTHSHGRTVTVPVSALAKVCVVCGTINNSTKRRSYNVANQRGCGDSFCWASCESVNCKGRIDVNACDSCEEQQR